MKDLSSRKQPSDDSLARLLKLAGPRPEPSAEIRDEVYEGVRAEWQARTRRGATLRRLLPAAIAATLVGTVAVFLWSQTQQTPVNTGPVARLDRGVIEIDTDGDWRSLRTGDALMSNVPVRTGAGSRAGLILLNGVSLRLDYDSQVQIETPGRIALNHGRLYVDTAQQHAGIGLEIVTASGIVRDIGTQFEVAVDPVLQRVRVRDGEVILNTTAGDYHAGRGEALALGGDGRVERSAISSHDASWDWAYDVAPLFDTDGRLVSELVDWVARETGRRAGYADAMTRNAAASTRIMGSVSARTPEETLELALETTRFQFELTDTSLAIDKNH